MDKLKAELLADQLIDIVDDYEGLGVSTASAMKIDFIKLLQSANL